jgi:hypothetical protein
MERSVGVRVRCLAFLLVSFVLTGAAGGALASDRTVLGELFTKAD